MLERAVTTAIAVPLAVIIIGWPGGAPAAIAAAVILTLAYGEYCSMCARAHIPCRTWWGAAAIVMLVIWAQNHTPLPSWYPELALALLWLFLIVETGRPDRRPVAAIGATLLGIAWIGGMGCCFVQVRFATLPDGFRAFGLESGAWMTLGLLIIIWCLDIFAYLVGRTFGKTRLAPSISPKKTIEGSVGGFFAAAIAGLLVAPMLGQSAQQGVVFGASMGVVGQMGDLFESAVKRELSVKDSGQALPGHGGWLDRIDSLLFASALAAWWIARLAA